MGFDHCSIASHTVTSSDGVGGARPNDRTGHSTASLDHVNPDEEQCRPGGVARVDSLEHDRR
jgi:hypothetical protein